ncbi:hypothetical protein PoB_002877000 [Plakobranchus ocellatus]|uniref:Uncharacterized protein n=1 Tax=Plakobranchus ocellatus TaxID=259542 RepID=A0AAV4A604_9GAST|nr:hypothetical protein PoB_002877000 [Plakobranchus ocellatus]
MYNIMQAIAKNPFSNIHLTGCIVTLLVTVSTIESWQASLSYSSRWSTSHDRSVHKSSEGACKSDRSLRRYTACPSAACLEGSIKARKSCCFKAWSFLGIVVKTCYCRTKSQCLNNNSEDEKRRPKLSTPSPPPPPPPPPPPAQPQPPTGWESSAEGYCTMAFEVEWYTRCPMGCCEGTENKYACCIKRDVYNDSDTCVCHPQKPCGPSETSPDSEGDGPNGDSNDQPDDDPDPHPSDPSDQAGPGNPAEDQQDEEEDSTSQSLCEEQHRLLNGDRVDEPCVYQGISRIIRRVDGEDVTVCNTVYTVAKVEGSVRQTFLTPQACKIFIETFQQDENMQLEVQIGDQTYPLQEPIFSTADGPNGNAFINISPQYTELFSYLGDCQSNACPYDPGAMRGKVDLNNCKAVSWGASNAATLTPEGLFEVQVAFYPGGCLEQEDLFGAANTLCFRTTDDENAYCSNDAGAPVYCMAPSTEEWILVGILAFQTACDVTAELKVIPFPL